MNVSLSEISAYFALAVSFASVYYTKRQSESAQLSFRNDYRANLSENHKRYFLALKEIRERHREEISTLCSRATSALTPIVHLFDEYDLERGSVRYLRHLVHESSEMIYCAFNGQLGWQRGANISHRFYRFLHVEDELAPSRHWSGNESFRRHIHKAYEANVNVYQESDLLTDFYFCDLVKQAKKRTDTKRGAELVLRVQKLLRPIEEILDELRSHWKKSVILLETMIKEGELEHFKLAESPRLLKEIESTQAKLDALSQLVFPRIEPQYAGCIYFPVSFGIYACALLHAIQGFHNWGWEYQQ